MNKLILFTLIFMALSITTKAQNDMSEKNKTEKKDIVNQSFGKIDFKKKLYAENVTNYLDLPTQIAKKIRLVQLCRFAARSSNCRAGSPLGFH